MKKKLTLLVLSFFVFSSVLWAHGGHTSITEKHAGKMAIEAMVEGIEKGQFESSWEKHQKFVKSEKLKHKDLTFWRFTFNNKSISEADKQVLYIFIHPSGQLMGYSYTPEPYKQTKKKAS